MQVQQSVAVTLAPLGGAVESLAWISSIGARGVQLSAAQPGLRPRELDAGARRDLRATLRRLELVCSGIDAWIPVERWLDGSTVEHTLDVVRQCCSLAAELGHVPVCLTLPGPCQDPPREERRAEAVAEAIRAAQTHDVCLADLTWSTRQPRAELPHPPVGGCIDPAVLLANACRPVPVITAAAGRVVAARVVDLLRNGARGPIGTLDGQLDPVEYRVALESCRFSGLPVIDARQWADPRAGVLHTMNVWNGLVPGIA